MAHPTHHASKARSLAARLTHTSSNRSGGGVVPTDASRKQGQKPGSTAQHTSSSRSRSGVAPTHHASKARILAARLRHTSSSSGVARWFATFCYNSSEDQTATHFRPGQMLGCGGGAKPPLITLVMSPSNDLWYLCFKPEIFGVPFSQNGSSVVHVCNLCMVCVCV